MKAFVDHKAAALWVRSVASGPVSLVECGRRRSVWVLEALLTAPYWTGEDRAPVLPLPVFFQCGPAGNRIARRRSIV